MRTRMAQHPDGRVLLAEQPRVTELSVNLPMLRTLPKSTFGAAYAAYMDDHEYVCRTWVSHLFAVGASPDAAFHLTSPLP